MRNGSFLANEPAVRRRNEMRSTKLLSSVVLIALLIPQITLGQGVGNLGSLPATIPMNTPNGWNITSSAGGPVPVVLDPAGPAWRKVLTDPTGGVFTAVPGQTFTLQ